MLIQLNGLVFLLGYYSALWRSLACFLHDFKHNSLAVRGASHLTFNLHCSIWELCIINSIFRLKIQKISLMFPVYEKWDKFSLTSRYWEVLHFEFNQNTKPLILPQNFVIFLYIKYWLLSLELSIYVIQYGHLNSHATLITHYVVYSYS